MTGTPNTIHRCHSCFLSCRFDRPSENSATSSVAAVSRVITPVWDAKEAENMTRYICKVNLGLISGEKIETLITCGTKVVRSEKSTSEPQGRETDLIDQIGCNVNLNNDVNRKSKNV